jgi:hypothetical protein
VRRWVGYGVFAALLALTVIEWMGAALADSPALVIWPAAVTKAVLIAVAFMHIHQLRAHGHVED